MAEEMDMLRWPGSAQSISRWHFPTGFWGCTNRANFIENSYVLYIYMYSYTCNILLFTYIFIAIF